jgi:hypothetical protein
MSVTALVTVAGVALPEPSEYSASTSTLVDSARNVSGYVIGSVIRNDVAKVELKWRYLTAQQWASVLSLFTNNFYNSVTFFNQATATYTTRQMYVGDRSAGIWRRHPETGAVMGFVDCSLSLVEV